MLSAGTPNPTCRIAQIYYILQQRLRILKLVASFMLQPFFRSSLPQRSVSATPITCPLQRHIYPTPSARPATSAMQQSKCHCVHESRRAAPRHARTQPFGNASRSNFLPTAFSAPRADGPELTRASMSTGNGKLYLQARRAIIEVKRYGSSSNRLLQPRGDVEA